ncbi:MAG: TULIP family P47-like protein [Rhodospirillales bacterium]|nr:TULIP family P47-like protein [Rhodospirillales bacterium]
MGVELTNGWDTVVATRVTNLNIGLRKAFDSGLIKKELDKDFTHSFFGLFKIDCNINTELGPFEINGGSGEIIEVRIPMPKGTFSMKNEDDTVQVDIDDWYFNIKLFLQRIDGEIVPGEGVKSDIIMNFEKDSLVSVLLEAPNIPEYLSDINIILNTKFSDLFSDTSYTIASVKLGFIQENYPYIVPKTFRYAIQEHTTGSGEDESSFGILMQTISKNPGTPALAYGTIPSTGPYCNTAALCSNQIFITYIVQPGLLKALGLNDNQLSVSQTTTDGVYKITNNGDLKLDNAISKAIKDLNITLRTLTLTVDDALVIDITGSAKKSIFIIDLSARLTLDIELNEKEQTISLVLNEDRSYYTTNVRMKWWVYLIEIFTFAFIMFFGGTAAAIVFAFAITLTNLIITSVVNNKIKQIVDDSLPMVIPDVVTWEYQKYFTISQLNLPTPLQVAGVIPFLEKDESPTIISDSSTFKTTERDAIEAITENRISQDYAIVTLNKEELLSLPHVDADKLKEIDNISTEIQFDRIGVGESNLGLTAEQEDGITRLLKPIEDQVFQKILSDKNKTLDYMRDPIGTLEKNDIDIKDEDIAALFKEIEAVFSKEIGPNGP